MDCRDLLPRLNNLKAADPRWVVEPAWDKKPHQLTHLFWMSPEQLELANCFHYLVIHDNTYRCNLYRLHLGCFTVINQHGKIDVRGPKPRHPRS